MPVGSAVQPNLVLLQERCRHQFDTWTHDVCPDSYLHQWTASVASRSNGSGCPLCSGRKVCKHNCLATVAPWAAAQWDYEANADTVVAYSSQPAGWHAKFATTKGLHHLCIKA